MAQVVGNKVKLNNGQLITPSTGGWYDGQQYWNGSLSAPGVINSQSDQPGAGQAVNAEVIAKQGNTAYIQQRQQEYAKEQGNNAPSGWTDTKTGVYHPAGGAAAPTGADIAALGSKAPTINLEAIYNTNYNTPEIKAAGDAVTAAQAEIDKATKARDEQLALINDNPLYSAGTMTGKQEKLNSKYNNDLNRLQNAKALAQDNVTKLKADAEIKVNLALKQYDIDSTKYKDNLSLFNTLLGQGALINASGSDIAAYAVATGIPTSMISSIVQKQQQDQIKPQVVTATDDNGVMTATVIDANTGNVINSTNLGKIDKATKGTSNTSSNVAQELKSSFIPALQSAANSYGHVGPADWQGALNSWISRGGDAADFISNFSQFTDPNRGDFEAAYGFQKAKRGITPPTAYTQFTGY